MSRNWTVPCEKVAQLSQRDGAAVWVTVVPQISILFSVFKEHCCRLLLQLRLLTGSG